jgi:hypothetical protein
VKGLIAVDSLARSDVIAIDCRYLAPSQPDTEQGCKKATPPSLVPRELNYKIGHVQCSK